MSLVDMEMGLLSAMATEFLADFLDLVAGWVCGLLRRMEIQVHVATSSRRMGFHHRRKLCFPFRDNRFRRCVITDEFLSLVVGDASVWRMFML